MFPFVQEKLCVCLNKKEMKNETFQRFDSRSCTERCTLTDSWGTCGSSGYKYYSVYEHYLGKIKCVLTTVRKYVLTITYYPCWLE